MKDRFHVMRHTICLSSLIGESNRFIPDRLMVRVHSEALHGILVNMPWVISRDST